MKTPAFVNAKMLMHVWDWPQNYDFAGATDELESIKQEPTSVVCVIPIWCMLQNASYCRKILLRSNRSGKKEMRKPTNDARGNIPAALWSGMIALWRAGARRPAWPLLMALLLFVSTPFAAAMDCSPEAGGHSHAAEIRESHHHADEDSGAPHHSDEASDHHDHAQVAAKGATLGTPATCCSCSSEPVSATVVAVSSPQQHNADSHAVIYVATSLLPTYRTDSLRGLNTRAGPPTGKPQRLSLVSHIGPAPPISL